MKKITLLLITIITLTITFSCNETKKKEQEKSAPTQELKIDAENTTIQWTAYKTTDKVPVKGSFAKFSVENKLEGNTIEEALNGLKFKIPVNSIVTNDTIRDAKLIKFLFGSMENTAEISGILHITSNSKTAEITMNGISQTFPINLTVNDNIATIEATIDLDNWKAQAALEALNIACNELHTGPDGISKTWSDVKIEVNIAILKP